MLACVLGVVLGLISDPTFMLILRTQDQLAREKTTCFILLTVLSKEHGQWSFTHSFKYDSYEKKNVDCQEWWDETKVSRDACWTLLWRNGVKPPWNKMSFQGHDGGSHIFKKISDWPRWQNKKGPDQICRTSFWCNETMQEELTAVDAMVDRSHVFSSLHLTWGIIFETVWPGRLLIQDVLHTMLSTHKRVDHETGDVIIHAHYFRMHGR